MVLPRTTPIDVVVLGTVLGMIHCFNTISRADGMGSRSVTW